MTNSPPTAKGRQEAKLDGRTLQFSTTTNNYHPRLPLGKNRLKILDQIADRWIRMGLYPSNNIAMIALLGGTYE